MRATGAVACDNSVFLCPIGQISLGDMTETVFQCRSPRDFTHDPAGFGRVQALRWKSTPSVEMEALSLAAQWQHAYAMRIREQISYTGSNLKAHARAAGTSYDRLGKLLRGVIVMRLEDIAVAEVLLAGISNEFVDLTVSTR